MQGQGRQLDGVPVGARENAPQDVVLQLEEELVAGDLLAQVRRVTRVELDAEAELVVAAAYI